MTLLSHGVSIATAKRCSNPKMHLNPFLKSKSIISTSQYIEVTSAKIDVHSVHQHLFTYITFFSLSFLFIIILYYEATDLRFRYSLFNQFIKTLTTLNLEYNEIGARGAEDVANALQRNKVKSF